MPTVRRPTQLNSSPMAGGTNDVPLSNVRYQYQNPDSFGVAPINPTQVADAQSRVATAGMRIADAVQRYNQRKATVLAEEAAVSFEREKNDLLFNPESGYFNRQGKDAFDTTEEINTQLQELQERYAGDLSDPIARDLFSRNASSQVTSARRDVARHSANQLRSWERATMEARVENSLENAALYWNDPDKLAVQLELGRQSVVDAGRAAGIGALAIAENIQTYASRFAANTIEAAAGESAVMGQKALGDYGSMLEGDVAVQMQAKIDRQLEVEKQQVLANSAVQQSVDLIQQFADEPNARNLIMDEINNIEDLELRDRTLQETMYRLNLRKQADGERRANSYNAAEEFLMDPQNGGIEEWISQNPTAWQDLDAQQKAQLKKGPVTQTNYEVWAELSLMTPEEQAELNPVDYFPYLANAERQKLINLVSDARSGNNFRSNIARTSSSQMNYAVEQLFGKKEDRNDEENKAVDQFYSLVMAEEQARTQAKGSDLTPDEYTQLINDFTRKAVITRSFHGVDWLVPDRDMYINDISPEYYTPLSENLRQNGKPVTSRNMLELYRQVYTED